MFFVVVWLFMANYKGQEIAEKERARAREPCPQV